MYTPETALAKAITSRLTPPAMYLFFATRAFFHLAQIFGLWHSNSHSLPSSVVYLYNSNYRLNQIN